MSRTVHSAAALLAAVPLFTGATPEALSALAERGAWRSLREGDVLFDSGERLERLLVLATGRLELLATHGRKRPPETVSQGRAVCEEHVFSRRSSRVRATALTDCELLEIPRSALVSHFERDPEMALTIMGGLSARVQELTREIRCRERPQARQRLVDYLLQQGGTDEGSATFTLHVRKATIAAKLRVTPEHLSRLLKELRQAGLVRVDQQRISVPDVRRLAACGTAGDPGH